MSINFTFNHYNLYSVGSNTEYGAEPDIEKDFKFEDVRVITISDEIGLDAFWEDVGNDLFVTERCECIDSIGTYVFDEDTQKFISQKSLEEAVNTLKTFTDATTNHYEEPENNFEYRLFHRIGREYVLIDDLSSSYTAIDLIEICSKKGLVEFWRYFDTTPLSFQCRYIDAPGVYVYVSTLGIYASIVVMKDCYKFVDIESTVFSKQHIDNLF